MQPCLNGGWAFNSAANCETKNIWFPKGTALGRVYRVVAEKENIATNIGTKGKENQHDFSSMGETNSLNFRDHED